MRSDNFLMNYETYSEKLLSQSVNRYHLSPEVVEAYRACPRHLFIKENYSIEEMYADYPLGIYQDKNFVSTISQPSFVLLMLDMLGLDPGHKVFELGAGSGWNAALMGYIVGPHGKVVSLEIIPDLARESRENLKQLGIKNVFIMEGDGARGYPEEAPYDRGVFTAGSTDLPRAFHEQIKVGGKLLFVLQGHFDSDLLILLEKKEDHFESLRTMACQFVPLKGPSDIPSDPESDAIIETRSKILIYPRKAPRLEGKNYVVRQDSIFYF